MAALAAFYLIQVALDVRWGNTFGNLGIDFSSFWSAGYIANHFGYAKVYDLQAMQQVQRGLVPANSSPAAVFHPIPTPYFALFLLPFQLLALLPPVSAFWLWTALNLAVFLIYVRFFTVRTTGQKPSARLLAMMLLAAPVFLTFFDGQVNVWLAICIGEYLREAIEGREVRAGLWLGGLLLKPQCLIILVPALLLQRSIKTMIGLAISGAAIVGGSTMLSGLGGLSALVRLWLGYASGLPTNDVQLMMNWRMIGLQISRLWSDQAGLAVAILGAVATFLIAMAPWWQRVPAGSSRFVVAVLGSLAATGTVAWHSHVHMAMILVTPLIYLQITQKAAFQGKLETWVFVGGGLYALRLMLASAVYARALSAEAIGIIDSILGLGLFGLNLYLLRWAIQWSRKPSEEANTGN